MSESAFELNIDELSLIADILMGAAHADGSYDGTEGEAIVRILQDELLGGHELPLAVVAHVEAFRPEAFELPRACAQLHLADSDDRRSLLALIAEVTDADEIHDEAEDAYIRRVAHLIGASEEEYAHLTMEIISISSVGGPPLPPPLPPGAR